MSNSWFDIPDLNFSSISKYLFIHSFIHLFESGNMAHKKQEHEKNMNEKHTDRDRLTKPCNTENTTVVVVINLDNLFDSRNQWYRT